MKFLWLLVAMVIGHNHPPPKSCEEWCEDTRCKCFDKCGPTYLERPEGCTDACNKTKENCVNECKVPHPTFQRSYEH